ncbi:alpha/beta fold hydrolase [Seongchinamella sediminis]|uniref:Alpha/beta fold hydrolase n=1 Tax=Seongchinamella sediminis TaxID=2283635 RepID=A0A3L7DY34_9GAMM|nr:alpha/beta fold hydrolase [Seongchinamella sediminis]RLQ21539.1 alpha/beta fold hydrolase [Seongchinamella sediminis]
MVAKSPIRHSTTGEGPPVVLLHGLFGAGGNLGALARSLARRYTVLSIDLPNHGRSAWLEQASLARMAQVVSEWMDGEGITRAALVGHSLGGKVAMEIALSQAERCAAAVIADIAPVSYPPHHDRVFAALDAVHAARVTSRQQAAELMAAHLAEEGVIQFLLMSLQRGEGGVYDWRFNLAGLKRDYDAVRAEPDVDQPFSGPVLFVKGGASDYILPAHRERVLALFPRAEVKVMPGCGHWLHAEQPELFNGIVGRFLQQHYSGA